jgi:HTH-type transcriptional regulator / antitoxin HigA
MRPKVLKTEKEYREAIGLIERLWNAPRGSRRADELELWSALAEDYEKARHPVAPPDPVEAVLFRMEQMGLRRGDLAKLLGGRSRVSEVLRRRRPFSLAMMRSLHKNLHVPAESLLAEPSAAYKP